MHISEFDYELPADLIARHPLPERTGSRLLCLDRASGLLEHAAFPDLGDRLQPGDLLVINDTRVLPGRLQARKETGGRVEIMVERLLDERTVLAQLGSNRTPAVGAVLLCGADVRARITRRDGVFSHIEFDRDVLTVLDAQGEMPLPPYLERGVEPADEQRYQTVYADRPGAVAAPTAGLHFDQDLLARLQDRGVSLARVTLHVGAGTFLPVREEDVTRHEMHAEYLEVSESVCDAVRATRARGGRVVAVGTTSMRALESAASDGELRPMAGETRLYILPGYRFRVCDALVTNFHLPRSTLLMLVSAFAGVDHIRSAYAEAIRQRYRFYSYGDAMFIHGEQP